MPVWVSDCCVSGTGSVDFLYVARPSETVTGLREHLSTISMRQLELLVAGLVIGSHVLFYSMGTLPQWARTPVTAILVVYGLLSLFFGAPIVLALLVLLCSVSEDIGVGSILSSGLALLTFSVVLASVYTIFNPPEGGGVFFGHIFTSLVAVPLGLLVLFRRALNRLFAPLWLYNDGIISRN